METFPDQVPESENVPRRRGRDPFYIDAPSSPSPRTGETGVKLRLRVNQPFRFTQTPDALGRKRGQYRQRQGGEGHLKRLFPNDFPPRTRVVRGTTTPDLLGVYLVLGRTHLGSGSERSVEGVTLDGPGRSVSGLPVSTGGWVRGSYVNQEADQG